MFQPKRHATIVLAAFSMLAAGCAEPPLEQQQSAQAALESARSADAETYASAKWIEAQDAMNRAEAELQAQNQKIGLLRAYGDAQASLAQAQGLAEQARQEALATKERARQETLAMLETTSADLLATRELLATVPQAKDTRAEIESMQQDLIGLHAALGEAAELLNAEDFTQARARIEQVGGRVAAIRGDIEAALAKLQLRR